jgi:L-seryl-tRNA(Ser) seleniumtransferase
MYFAMEDKGSELRKLPQVDELLRRPELADLLERTPRRVVVAAARMVLEERRRALLAGEQPGTALAAILDDVAKRAESLTAPRLRRVINATGVVVHTNLGRSLLAEEAVYRAALAGSAYSNLEFDLAQGKRGQRNSLTQELLTFLTGAEAALVVNNNAGAVFLTLNTLARGREVIVSRGELVEIGGSFRIPDVMAASGARLIEVGTTNRTHPHDYARAIGPDTALLLKVHRSNFEIVGFTAEVSVADLAALGERSGIPVVNDLGSGSLIDFSRYGLKKEPTVQESLQAGSGIVTFSGDKLLGGPQAGIIVGQRDLIRDIRRNPLNRALRPDKLTLAALEATLRLYLDEPQAIEAVPTLRMIITPGDVLRRRAQRLLRLIKRQAGQVKAGLRESVSRIGGGALPLEELPTWTVAVSHAEKGAARIEAELREQELPVIGRVEQELLLLDVRTIQEDEVPLVAQAVSRL